jgi:hypothetical protein
MGGDGKGIIAEHFTETMFHDVFRKDLSSCRQSALILSPFVSKNRIASYFPVFLVLLARNVEINVYSRPRDGQPESLRDGYDQIIRRLKKMGVHLRQRAEMHEKIGIFDEQILWHGSLNILSHNATKESMLRFESSELVSELLDDLNISLSEENIGEEKKALFDGKDDSQADLTCHLCGDVMSYFEDAGLWICKNSPQCSGTQTGERQEFSEVESVGCMGTVGGIICPICKAPMVERPGIFRKIECSVDTCDFSFDRRLSAAIRRILGKRS